MNLDKSIASNSTCMQNGRFFVEFYILHSADTSYNGINQRYWLQYHKASNIIMPTLALATHLIKPTDLSEQLAARHKLVPFRQLVNLTHESTYIRGPFEWTTVRGREMRDLVSLKEWNALSNHVSMFSNNLPKFNILTFYIHVDNGIHSTFCSDDIYNTISSCTNINLPLL